MEVNDIWEEVELEAGTEKVAILVGVRDENLRLQLQARVNSTQTPSHVRIEVDEARYQPHVDDLGNSGARRLSIIFAKSFDGKLSIPDAFKRCMVVSCNGAEAHLHEDSSYCGMVLTRFYARPLGTYPSHALSQGSGVYFHIPDFKGPISNPPCPLKGKRDVEAVSQKICETMYAKPPPEKNDLLVFLAALTGISAGAGMGALIVSKVDFAAGGIHLVCQTTAIGAASLGVGLAAGAAMYFIPWKKLARWFQEAWSLLIDFLWAVWDFVQPKLEEFLGCIATILLANQPDTGKGGTGLWGKILHDLEKGGAGTICSFVRNLVEGKRRVSSHEMTPIREPLP